MNRPFLLVLVASLVFLAPVSARQASEPPKPGDTQPADLLGGPKVNQAEARRVTLVESDYEGKVKRLEVAPEEAAVRLLNLSDMERVALDAVFVERTRLMDAFITDHLDLLLRLGSAGESGDKAAQLRGVFEAFQATKGIREKGPLAKQVREALAPANQERFDALLNEYWDAVVAERQAVSKKAGKREGRLGIVIDERFKSFGKEIERAFGRVVDPGSEREFDELLAALDLRPEQESRIRRMAGEFIISTKFKPTERQEQMFVAKMASILDQRQRRLLAERIAEEERGKAGMMNRGK